MQRSKSGDVKPQRKRLIAPEIDIEANLVSGG